MSEQQTQPQSHEGWWKKLLRVFGVADSVIDAGLLAGLAALWYRTSAGHGNFMSNIGGTGTPETVAPKLADEANFARLLTYLEVAGGAKGLYFADHLDALEQAFITIHPTYGEQFRNMLFSGVTEAQVVTRFDKLFNDIVGANDADAWNVLNASKDMIVQQALRSALRIENEIKTGVDRENAALKVAQWMIKKKKLPGSVVTHTEERFSKASDTLNLYLQRHNQKRNEERLVEIAQEKKIDTVGLVKMIFAVGVLLFFLVEIYTASTAPMPENETANPLAPLEHKLSQGVGKTYQFITQEQGE